MLYCFMPFSNADYQLQKQTLRRAIWAAARQHVPECTGQKPLRFCCKKFTRSIARGNNANRQQTALSSRLRPSARVHLCSEFALNSILECVGVRWHAKGSGRASCECHRQFRPTAYNRPVADSDLALASQTVFGLHAVFARCPCSRRHIGINQTHCDLLVSG